MTTPLQYIERLKAIMSDALWETNPDYDGCMDTREEAEALIVHMRHRRHDIESLKREVSATISAIKSHHASASAFVGTDLTHLFTSLAFGHRVAGKINTIQRDLIRHDKVTDVSPFEDIKRIADECCNELEVMRDRLQASNLFQASPDLQQMDSEPEPEYRLFCHISEQVKGPYTFTQMQALHDTGVVTDSTLCCYEGTEDCVSLPRLLHSNFLMSGTTHRIRSNKTDACNDSDGICRVGNVLCSPSPDPKRSANHDIHDGP